MVVQNIDDLHAALFDMLRVLDSIAKESGTPYYLGYGTALGAMREKDFIDWDPDVDILIHCGDYERMLSALTNALPGKYKIYEPRTTPGYEFMFARLGHSDVDHNVLHIDLFPLSGAPNKAWLKWLYCKGLMVTNKAFTLKMLKLENRFWYPPKKRLMTRVGKTILAPVPSRFFMTTLGLITTITSIQSSGELYSICGSYGMKEYIPKTYMNVPSKGYIRDTPFPVPTKPSEYLTHFYGNYNQLPHAETRNATKRFWNHVLIPGFNARSGSEAK